VSTYSVLGQRHFSFRTPGKSTPAEGCPDDSRDGVMDLMIPPSYMF